MLVQPHMENDGGYLTPSQMVLNGSADADPHGEIGVQHTFPMRGGTRLSGMFHTVIPGHLYRVIACDKGSSEHIKVGGFVAAYIPHRTNKEHVRAPVQFDYCDNAYRAERRMRKLATWCGAIEGERLGRAADSLSTTFRMAVRLRAANPEEIALFEQRIAEMLAEVSDVTTRTTKVYEAIQKLTRLARKGVDVEHLTAQYPVVWCVEDRVRNAEAMLGDSERAYGTAADVMARHNTCVATLVRGWRDDLEQMSWVKGRFNTPNRAQRLHEFLEDFRDFRVRPWSRCLTRCGDDVEEAFHFLNAGDVARAKECVEVAVIGLDTLVYRDEVEGLMSSLSLVSEFPTLVFTDAELLALMEKMRAIVTGLSTRSDDKLFRPVRYRLSFGVVDALGFIGVALGAGALQRDAVRKALHHLRLGVAGV